MRRDEHIEKKMREVINDGSAIGLSIVLRTEPPMAGHYVVRAHMPAGHWIDYPPDSAEGLAVAFQYFAGVARDQQRALDDGGKAPS